LTKRTNAVIYVKKLQKIIDTSPPNLILTKRMSVNKNILKDKKVRPTIMLENGIDQHQSICYIWILDAAVAIYGF
jgi:hypothetical protein